VVGGGVLFELVFFSSSPSACHGLHFYPCEGNAIAGGRNAFTRLLHSALVARAINSWSISAHIAAAAAVDRYIYIYIYMYTLAWHI